MLLPLGLGAQVIAHISREIKIGQPNPPDLYILLPIPDEWGDHVAIDFVGPLSLDNGFNMICMMTCHLGSDIQLIPTHQAPHSALTP